MTDEQLNDLAAEVTRTREKYMEACKSYLAALDPSEKERDEAEEGAYQYFEDRMQDEYLDYTEIFADIIAQNREMNEEEE